MIGILILCSLRVKFYFDYDYMINNNFHIENDLKLTIKTIIIFNESK
jgi:hypothetical protein